MMNSLSIILSMGPDRGPASLKFRGKTPTQVTFVQSGPSPSPADAIARKEDPAKISGSKKVLPGKNEAKEQSGVPGDDNLSGISDFCIMG